MSDFGYAVFCAMLVILAGCCGAAVGVYPGLWVSAAVGWNLSAGAFWGGLCGLLLATSLMLYQIMVDYVAQKIRALKHKEAT